MSAISNFKGAKITWNEKAEDWFHEDGTKHEVTDVLECPKCKEKSSRLEHDPCLKDLPGVMNACCGHGSGLGYIQFINGVTIHFTLANIKKAETCHHVFPRAEMGKLLQACTKCKILPTEMTLYDTWEWESKEA